MQRRQFLKSTLAGGVVLGVGGIGALWLSQRSDPTRLNIAAVLNQLDTLTEVSDETLAILSTGEWNMAQVFTHCAQSVEYSMKGFPEHKSQVFQQTVGHLAFSAFMFKGTMTHNLSEPIPSAPTLEIKEDVRDALTRFKYSLKRFQKYNGGLAPHFAYGLLTKSEYEIAHAMHWYNHLDEINLELLNYQY